MNLHVLPLAITMMAGPQIMCALVLLTARRPVAASGAFVAGVAVATCLGVVITTGLASALSLGAGHREGSFGKVLQYALVVVLVLLALRNWRNRETADPPAWLGSLQSAGPGRAFRAGLLLIGLFPSDVVVLFTVGITLSQDHAGPLAALPFVLATVLIAAAPLLTYLLVRDRAEAAVPVVRDWLTGHGWLVNIIVCLFFAVLILV
ncbi:hypothetical protein GCM10010174_46650 [Kutzneria viridogrisea]|uniref:Threonine/homoserine/homoserine lactone efflux protein n=2 Tax=Kutzneria TaxID=43356 RepID=A0ABR6BII6_9PSEU|nr:GAP family protein [Kutzneria albida]AHH95782.1 putative secreted protein [Kutzneria albida DSM 43870]MBA8926697.1 threonine/homoserine/homoserine lactone efflux protein [Kutzneria viridogrisea]